MSFKKKTIMDIKLIKKMFFNLLKSFNEKEICLLMDYLCILVKDYKNDYSKFYGNKLYTFVFEI